jgi:hypothetical protein
MTTFSRVAVATLGALIGSIGFAQAPASADPKTADKPAGMAEHKPPAELTEMAKGAAGTWRCKGQGMDHTMKMADMTGTLKQKLDLDNWWIHSSFESNMGKEPFHFEEFTTFDPETKKWKRVIVESGGGWGAGESSGLHDNKVDWELAMHTMMGESTFRDHVDLSDPKAGMKMRGEFSPDKGKTWVTVYEMACKK